MKVGRPHPKGQELKCEKQNCSKLSFRNAKKSEKYSMILLGKAQAAAKDLKNKISSGKYSTK